MNGIVRNIEVPSRGNDEVLQYRDRGSSINNYILRGGIIESFASDNVVLAKILTNRQPQGNGLYMQGFPTWPWNGIEFIPFQKTGERFPAGVWRRNSIVETATIRDDEMVTETWRIVPLTQVMANDPAGAVVSWAFDVVEELTGRGFGIGNLGVWVLSSRTTAPAYGSSSRPALSGPVSSGRSRSSRDSGKMPWWLWLAGLFLLRR
jgi:hypothetical protein